MYIFLGIREIKRIERNRFSHFLLPKNQTNRDVVFRPTASLFCEKKARKIEDVMSKSRQDKGRGIFVQMKCVFSKTSFVSEIFGGTSGIKT